MEPSRGKERRARTFPTLWSLKLAIAKEMAAETIVGVVVVVGYV